MLRIDGWAARAALAAALLTGGAGGAVAQQAAPTAPGAPAVPAAPSADGKAVFTADHVVRAGETVEDIVVVGGDLRVEGTVTGDAVVVGGQLILEPSGTIEGDATVTGGSILENGGQIRGEMRTLEGAGDELSGAAGAMAAGEAARAQARAEMEVRDRESRDWEHRRGGWFRPIRDGFFGLVSTFAFGLLLAGAGAVLVFYGRQYLDTVSDTIRANTLRAGAVGLAATFLVIPAFVVLVVALAVSIIGIPFLLIAVPLYPLAIAAACGMGLLGAAHAIGERTSEQRSTSFDFRYRNSYSYLFTGLGMLLMPLLAASLIKMTGFLAFLGVILQVLTWVVIWAATMVGFGAVILSRAGTQRTFARSPLDMHLDPEPYDTEPTGAGPHV